MIHSFFLTGRFTPLSERRLCRLSGPVTPGEGPSASVEATNDFIESMLTRARDFVTGEERIKASRANLRSDIAWIQAFETLDFSAPPRGAAMPNVVTPKDVLEAMPADERVAAYYRFIRQILPARMFLPVPPAAAPIAQLNYPDYVRPSPSSAVLPVPAAADRAFVLRIASIVAGKTNTAEIAGLATETSYARIAFQELYPVGSPGFIAEDFRAAVDRLRADLRGRGAAEPTNADLSNPDYLRRNLRPGRFLGWLSAMLAEPGGAVRRIEVERTIVSLNNIEGQRERKQKLEKLSSEMERQKIDKSIAETTEQRNRTIYENFGRMEQWQQFAVAGLGIYALYKMWNSRSRVLNAVPPALLGTYLYLRLVQGDDNALQTMTGAGQTLVNRVGGLLAQTGRSMGILPQDPQEVERSRLALMGRYMDQKAFLSLYPNSLAFLTLSETKMGSLATAFRITGSPRGPFQTSLFAAPRDPLHTEMEGVIRRRNYDRQMVFSMFERDNPRISAALGTVFYHIAAKNPRNRDKVRLVEDARRRAGPLTADGRIDTSYDRITNAAARTAYIDLVRDGSLEATTTHANKDFSTMIAELMAPAAPEAEPDLAEHISVADRYDSTRGFRRAEAGVLAIRERPLDPTREPSLKAFRGEFEETLARLTRAPNPILDPAGAKRYRDAAERILTDVVGEPVRPLPTILYSLHRLEYAVTVAALKRGDGSAVTIEDMNEILEGFDNPGWVQTSASTLGNFINRTLVTLDSGFRDVENIESVKAILRGRFFAGAVNGGNQFASLTKHLNETQSRVHRMRRAREEFVNALDAATIARMGGRGNAELFAGRMMDRPEYQQILIDAERDFAQGVATDLAEAMLSTHRRSGNHLRTLNASERRVTPVEEENIIVASRERANRFFGPPDRPLRGMWFSLAMREHLRGYTPATDLNRSQEPSRMGAINHVRGIATLYMSVQPMPDAEVTTHLRSRVRFVAQNFLSAHTDAVNAGVAQANEIRATESFRQGIPDIIKTMQLLNMTIGADEDIVESLEGILKLGNAEAAEKAEKAKKNAEEAAKKAVNNAQEIAKKGVENAQKQADDAAKAVKNAEEAAKKAEGEVNSAQEAMKKAQQAVKNAEEAAKKAAGTPAEEGAKKAVENAQQAFKKAQEELSNAQAQAKKAQGELKAAQENSTKAQQALKNAQEAAKKAQEEVKKAAQELVKQLQGQIKILEQNAKQAQTALKVAEEAAKKSVGGPGEEAAKKAVENAQQAAKKAEGELKNAQEALKKAAAL